MVWPSWAETIWDECCRWWCCSQVHRPTSTSLTLCLVLRDPSCASTGGLVGCVGKGVSMRASRTRGCSRSYPSISSLSQAGVLD